MWLFFPQGMKSAAGTFKMRAISNDWIGGGRLFPTIGIWSTLTQGVLFITEYPGGCLLVFGAAK
jgi:hypothetical protein